MTIACQGAPGAFGAVVATHALPIRIDMLALAGARLDGVAMIISHPMALAQGATRPGLLAIATGQASDRALAAQERAGPRS